MLSLPWLEAGSSRVRFCPVARGMRTVVVRWATLDPGGLKLDTVAIRRGAGSQVHYWDVRPATRDKIERIMDVWSPEQHDLYVDGSPDAPSIGPTLRGLWSLDPVVDAHELRPRVADAVARWCRPEPAEAEPTPAPSWGEPWVTVDEIAVHLGVSSPTVMAWVKRRAMPAARIGRLWRFKKSEVDAWVRT